MLDALAILCLLIGLELVLGVDNVLVISIFVERSPEERRQKARVLGLGFALGVELLQMRHEYNKRRLRAS